MKCISFYFHSINKVLFFLGLLILQEPRIHLFHHWVVLAKALAPCGLILWDVLLVSIWPQVQKSAPVPTQQKRMVAQYIHLVRIVGMFNTVSFLTAKTALITGSFYFISRVFSVCQRIIILKININQVFNWKFNCRWIV